MAGPARKRSGSWFDQFVDFLANTDGAEYSLARRMRAIIIFGLILLVLFAIRWGASLLNATLNLDVVLPTAMASLDVSSWKEFGLTAAASIYSFVLASAFAYLLGLGASMLIANKSAGLRLSALGIRQVYNFFYIVPVVVTVNLVLTGLLQAHFLAGAASQFIVLAGLAVAAICIGGHPVFSVVYDSAVHPKRRHLTLTQSLYSGDGAGAVKSASRMLKQVQRLNDGEVQAFCESIVRCWHLSIVAVVIVESVSPGIYRHLGLTTLISPTGDMTLGGVGREVLEEQSSGSVQRVAGFMWALFFFDLVGVAIIEGVMRFRYLRHYGGAK